MPYTCLIYSEGGRESKFISLLISLDKFKYHLGGKWEVFTGNTSGGHPKDIFDKCRREIRGRAFDLVICVVDQNLLKQNNPEGFEQDKLNLEIIFSDLKIIWQEDCLEDELREVLEEEPRKQLSKQSSKHRVNKVAKDNIQQFVNSKIWNKLKEFIKTREVELDSQS